MDKFQPTVLVKLINFYNPKNIIGLKNSFIQQNINEDNIPFSTLEDNGVLSFYDSGDNRFYEKKFEDTLDPLLWNLTNELKAEIEQSNVLLSKKDRNSYWNRVIDVFETFLVEYKDIFELFPTLNKPKEEIEKYLSNKFNYEKLTNKSDFSYFELKSGIPFSVLGKIYDFLIEDEYLNDEVVSEDDFKSVLNDIETTKLIKFNCNTIVASVILRELESFFSKLNFNEVENSQRFLSKQGNILSATNLYKSYSSSNKNHSIEKQKIENFFNKFS